MNNIKSVLIVAVLGVVAYGMYSLLTGGGRELEDGALDDWPDVQRTADATKKSDPAAATAPQSAAAPAPPPTVLAEVPAPNTPPAPYPDPGPAYPAQPLAVQPLAAPIASPPSDVIATSGIAPPQPPAAAPIDAPIIPAVSPQTAAENQLNPAQFPIALSTAQTLVTEGRLIDALQSLSAWYAHPGLTPSDQQTLLQALDYLAGVVIYSRQHLLERPYEVQPGDSLNMIAQAYEVPWELLAKINGQSDPQRLRAGDMLKVVRGPFQATVELDQFRLTMWIAGMYAGRFTIGIGQDQSTPMGDFTVLNKVVNPTYYGPQVVDADDPANPLGEHWIDLGNRIGIHGTIEPQTIGRAESRGCIRLLPNEVQDVFDMLSVGSKVTIRR